MIGGGYVDGNCIESMDERVSMMIGDGRGLINMVDERGMIGVRDGRGMMGVRVGNDSSLATSHDEIIWHDLSNLGQGFSIGSLWNSLETFMLEVEVDNL